MGCSQSTANPPKPAAPKAAAAPAPKASVAAPVAEKKEVAAASVEKAPAPVEATEPIAAAVAEEDKAEAAEEANGEEKAVEAQEEKTGDDTAASCMAGGLGGVTKEYFEQAKHELDELVAKGARVPDRGDLDKPEIKWRSGKPNYTLANLTFLKGKRMNHEAGSLEEIVENIVKQWEMEASHKADIEQWETVSLPDGYKVSANGSEFLDGRVAAQIGNYNALMMGCPKDKYDAEKETFESSHHLFRDAFPKGFPWELLEVYSGPPKISFSWRHWASFSGTFRGNQGEGQLVELFGLCQATVNSDLKIVSLEIFYKPNEFIDTLEGKCPINNAAFRTCPFLAGHRDQHEHNKPQQ